MTKFKCRAPIKPEGRASFAATIARIISTARDELSTAQMTNAGDSRNWSVDQLGNDWWVNFEEDDLTLFTVQYRYTKKTEEAFAAWLCHQMPVSVVQ